MPDRKRLAALLVHISDWCVEHRLRSGFLQDFTGDLTTSIFVNGDLARVLTCTYEITGEKRYLDEAVQWCDFFVNYGIPTRTSKNNEAIYWWDIFEVKNLYLADTGTAVTSLFKAYPHVDAERQKRYLETLVKFYRLCTEGTDRDPTAKGLPHSPGWVIQDGPDAGAFGIGYRHGRLEQRPYVISTGQAGALACSMLFKLTGDARYRKTAVDAARWLLRHVNEKGNIPYIIEGGILEDYVFQAIHYCSEGLIAAYEFCDDEALRQEFRNVAPRMRDFILSVQTEKGYWGTERAYDGQRSVFLPHFLDWYQRQIAPDAQAAAAVERFFAYVLNPANTTRFGVNNLVNINAFLGCVAASAIEPDLDICHPSRVSLREFNISELRREAEKFRRPLEDTA